MNENRIRKRPSLFGKSLRKNVLIGTLILSLSTIFALWSGASSSNVGGLIRPAHAMRLKYVTDHLISLQALEKYETITVSADDNGVQKKYEGVPLRSIIAATKDFDMDSMEGWKKIARWKLVVVVIGDDGYPGVVTLLEIAMNKSGDKFILATKCDGKAFENAPQLIVKNDEARTRWVRKVVRFEVKQVK